VGRCIEVHGVHDIGYVLNGIFRHQVQVLVPVGAARQDNVIGVDRPDHSDHLFGIGFHLVPLKVIGLVPYLVDHVRVIPVPCRHLSKEAFGLFGIFVMGMKIDDDIYTVINRGFNDGCDAL